jgi:hypothetical protein
LALVLPIIGTRLDFHLLGRSCASLAQNCRTNTITVTTLVRVVIIAVLLIAK